VNGLQKKLGPLKVWQWAMIGAALGAAILIMRNREGGEAEPTGEVFGGTGTGAYGPIDPESGIPYAFEGGGSSSGTASAAGESLDSFLERVGMLREQGLLGEEGEPTETVIERITEPQNSVVAASKTQQKAKAKTAHEKREGGSTGSGGGKKPTSTGSAASPGGSSHTAAPHPATRIAVGGAKALTGANKGKQQGGGSSKNVKGGGAGNGNKGGGGNGGGGSGNKGGGGDNKGQQSPKKDNKGKKK
jgi:hypothetical protein